MNFFTPTHLISFHFLLNIFDSGILIGHCHQLRREDDCDVVKPVVGVEHTFDDRQELRSCRLHPAAGDALDFPR